ncbi:ent-kaurenoic acid oxidase 1 isoform X1 [Brachypodium distachyon]|uniref:ent-kaurenoic acid monooxygenase n=1 Tax=Brachypodium distachyon TaxID=15368 RepID=I1IVE3_BRADI|nr:ent-kaurenoic acid oxidase 1 isoform X1 [Brachypodium distachyon]KQJ81398.1 hypothetical protein BRADI_5g00467v3 [Brachypodium distachyon]|eukprot:XP_003580920.1 ent-kaurenoic acid oxidase 1 isoform X1 [Brachypodium distachyon]
MWWWAAVAVGLAVVVVVDGVVRKAHAWYWVGSLGAERRARLPPGDMGWPLVGGMWAFLRAFKSGKPDAFIDSLVGRYGRTGLYRSFMYSSPSVLVTTPEACKKVLMDDVAFVNGWPEATLNLIGTRSFTSPAMPRDEHRRLRKLTAAPVNGSTALAAYLGFIDHNVTSTLRRWSSSSEPVEFLTELRRMTFLIIVRIFMSRAAEDEGTMAALEQSYSELNHGMRAMAINLPGFAYHKALKARRKLVAVLQGVLDDRRRCPRQASVDMDMMDRLIEVEDEGGRRLEDEEIIDMLVLYLNAGHESSAHITMWATVFMQENSHILSKAKAEQEEIMKNIPLTQKGLTLRDYKKMEYLSQVIDETLRFVNISFVTFRQATRDVFVNGYLIPKGWKVQLWYRSVHMDPQLYSEPNKFNPSRWEGPPPKVGTFLPFGLGPKLCPGNDLAKLEISVFLHHFLLGYKLTRENPSCRIRYLPHPRPVDNCLAKVTRVSSNEY